MTRKGRNIGSALTSAFPSWLLRFGFGKTSHRSSRSGGDRMFYRKFFQESRKQWRRFTVAGLLFWAVYVLALGSGGAVHYFQLKQEHDHLVVQNRMMVAQRDSLDCFINAITDLDEDMIEKVAREEYGLIRSNERVYRLPTSSQ